MPTVPIPRRRTLVLVMVGVLLPTVFLLVRSVRLQREMLDFQNRILAEYARYSVDYAVAEVQSLIRAREREVHMHFHMLAMLQEFVPETELGRIEHTYPLIEHAFLVRADRSVVFAPEAPPAPDAAGGGSGGRPDGGSGGGVPDGGSRGGLDGESAGRSGGGSGSGSDAGTGADGPAGLRRDQAEEILREVLDPETYDHLLHSGEPHFFRGQDEGAPFRLTAFGLFRGDGSRYGVAGFFLRLPHVRRKLLGSVLAQAIETAEGRLPPDFGRDLTFVVYDHTGQRVYVHQRPGQHAVPDPKTALATAELWDVLPGWTVRLVYSDPKGGKYPRDIWVANTLLLVLTGTIAVAGALLAMRYMMRQVELANLKAHFVSNITHELKTPLAAIRLYTETLQQGRIQDPVQEREFLGIIQKESGRLEQLIHNILDFARIDSGQRRYTFEPAAVGDVVRDVVEAYSLPLRAQGFAVRLDIDPCVPEVWMDRAAFKGAILNLLDNAAKYSRERKQIEVRVACTGQGAEADGASGQAGAFGAEGRASAIGVEGRADALGAEGQSDPFGAAETSDAAAAGALDTGTAPDAGAAREVEIRVRDRGIGIQAAETGKIFEAFYRVEKGLDQEVQGAGLGLALVKHVVEAHGGSIGVESSRGEGSAFTIRLPVRERPPAPAPARNGAALARHVSRLGWKPAAPRRGA